MAKSFIDKHPVVTTLLDLSAFSWIGYFVSKILKTEK
jgi:hypothetical protein